jgi:hypothetical protein
MLLCDPMAANYASSGCYAGRLGALHQPSLLQGSSLQSSSFFVHDWLTLREAFQIIAAGVKISRLECFRS